MELLTRISLTIISTTNNINDLKSRKKINHKYTFIFIFCRKDNQNEYVEFEFAHPLISTKFD